MKKVLALTLAFVALAAFSTASLAQDDDAVYAVNTIGVVKYTIPGNGGFACISLPLNPMDGEWLWPNTSIAQQLENESTAYFWDGTAWQASTKSRRGWDGIGSTKVIEVGEAFFVQTPASSSDKVISLLGELPTDDSMSYQVRGSGNLDTRGVTPYPVEISFTNSTLAKSLANDSTVSFWDGSSWQASTKSRRGWDGLGPSKTLAVGEGVFVQSTDSSAKTIEEERPFDWK